MIPVVLGLFLYGPEQQTCHTMERAEETEQSLPGGSVGKAASVSYPWTGEMSDRFTMIKDRLLETQSNQFALTPDNFR